MKLFKRINTTTGDFIEDCLFESQPMRTEMVTEEIEMEGVPQTRENEAVVLDPEGNPIPDTQYIDVEVPQGFYLPRWDGGTWVEGGHAPDPAPQPPTEVERIEMLENTLLQMLFM